MVFRTHWVPLGFLPVCFALLQRLVARSDVLCVLCVFVSPRNAFVLILTAFSFPCRFLKCFALTSAAFLAMQAEGPNHWYL